LEREGTPRSPLAGRSFILALVLGFAVLLGSLLVPWTHFGETTRPGDVLRYFTFAQEMVDGRLPYHDFFMEYPPGQIPLFLAPELAGRSASVYTTAFQWLVVGLTVLLVVAVVETARRLGQSRGQVAMAAAWVAAAPVLLGSVYFLRNDIWPALLTAVALLAILDRRDRTAAALLGVGTATKFYPALLLPLLLVRIADRRGRSGVVRAVAWFVGAFAVVVGPFAMFGFGGVGYSFRSQLTRPLEIESLGGAALLSLHRLGMGHPDVRAGLSFELGGHLPRGVGVLQSIVLALLLVAIWVMFARTRHGDRELVLAATASVAAVLALAKVVSPQYLIWLVPLVALLERRLRPVAWSLLATAMIMTAAYYPSHFRSLVLLGPVAWLVLARDIVLIALAAYLIAQLAQQARALSWPA
jgi:hypothetical protein